MSTGSLQTLLITGAAGFIGSHFVRKALDEGAHVVAFDALTYAGHRINLAEVESHPRFRFVQGDLRDHHGLRDLLRELRPTAVVHLAAESHVDNSIQEPQAFVETNILGTYHLLEACRHASLGTNFRFLHVSTDEVFGSLREGLFTEASPYRPRSPYSATKAGADHLVQAWFHTYDLPVVITNGTNNYGPRQMPEKLIPRMIACALEGQPLPVYGKGENVRDWIHVEDHCEGLWLALKRGEPGETYGFSSGTERSNLQLVHALCETLDLLSPRKGGQPHAEAIRFVPDRAGHDFRYALDNGKARRELGFEIRHPSLEKGLEDTVRWYLAHPEWLNAVKRESR